MSHWQHLAKIRPTDTLFSRWVRIRDGHCMFAIRCYGVAEYADLQCCHFWGRGRESVRFDPENADAGCRKCHDWIDSTVEGRQWHEAWKLNQLGQRAYDLLQIRAESKDTRDDRMMRLVLQEMLKEQEMGRREELNRYGSLA